MDQNKKASVGSPSLKEIEELLFVAQGGYSTSWVIDFAEELKNIEPEVNTIGEKIEGMINRVRRTKGTKLAPTSRQFIAETIKEVISLGNDVERNTIAEMRRNCIDGIPELFQRVNKAHRLLSKKRSKGR
jgi:translation initiation factor 2B subunit (eIF-2B alpha/beta/delta family)